MQFKAVVVSAIAATVAAQETSPDVVSILSVLQTALPSTLVQEALTNSAAAASDIASQFAAGSTPSWYTGLPTDIQNLLNPTDPAVASSFVSELTASLTSLAANATAVPGAVNGTRAAGNATAIISSISARNSSVIANASSSAAGSLSSAFLTASSTGGSSTGGSSTGGSGSAASASRGSSGSSSSSSAGAAMPTALYGMGLAGVVGMVGVFAL